MRRALSFIREHLGEALTLERVARAAGFAPKYFSQLFHQSEGMSYATYLRDLRLARAKEMLKLSRLSVDRVARFLRVPHADPLPQRVPAGWSE